jgi:hypothetical protein
MPRQSKKIIKISDVTAICLHLARREQFVAVAPGRIKVLLWPGLRSVVFSKRSFAEKILVPSILAEFSGFWAYICGLPPKPCRIQHLSPPCCRVLVAGGWATTHMGSSFTTVEPFRLAVQIPRRPTSDPSRFSFGSILAGLTRPACCKVITREWMYTYCAR